jgi:L-ascorbate metabolism protein UlaG (beta-lactamase superfamily)
MIRLFTCRMRCIALLALSFLVVAVACGYLSGLGAMGASAVGDRLARMQASPQWQVDHFANTLPEIEPALWPATVAWFTDSSPYSIPETSPPILRRSASDFESSPASGLRITWLGHSTLLVEIDSYRILIDPVWGERTSPFTWMGPERFHEPPLPWNELPTLDAVLISHDHYDHLDMPTIRRLIDSDVPILVPLGVGAHLEHWQIPAERIIEHDWWDEYQIGNLRLVTTPARHFSGRSMLMTDRMQTLWAGWALIGPEHRIYYSGDTAMFPGFHEIGQRLGPFDATMIESGAYNQLWRDVHVGPEQAVQAHVMVGGQVMIPVHWGTFDLALHSWTEPVERVLIAAQRYGVTVAAPQPGQSIEPASVLPPTRWWPAIQWETAAEAPVVSSNLNPALLPQPGS